MAEFSRRVFGVSRCARLTVAGLLLGASVNACGSSKKSNPDDNDAGISEGFVAVNVQVEEVFGGAVRDMELCIWKAQPKNCANTDAQGRVLLKVAEDSEFGLTLDKKGYAKALLPTRVAAESIELTPVALPESVYQVALETAGITQATDKGSLLTFQSEGQAQATLTPASGDGPYYFNGLGLIDPEATEVPEGGGVLFANLELGEAELALEYPPGQCRFPETAWDGGRAQATRFPAVAEWGTGLWPPTCAVSATTSSRAPRQ